jgi:hypothetical protein
VIDFNHPENYVAQLEAMTLEIEDQCPWAAYDKPIGTAIGIGEGIVFVPTELNHTTNTELWFKTKGFKHKNEREKDTSKINVTPGVSKDVLDCVDKILPEWRLEQGISQLNEEKVEIVPENMGRYLKWIGQDIQKEESDIIEESGLDWKQLAKVITTRAKAYFYTQIEL